jgi:hypothetical protein
MSAAANAAGYLYARGQLGALDLNAQVDSARPQGQSAPVKPVRTPKIEYRKRRAYALPSAA